MNADVFKAHKINKLNLKMEYSLEVSSQECTCRSDAPYADVRKRAKKRRRKQAAFIAKQLKHLEDI